MTITARPAKLRPHGICVAREDETGGEHHETSDGIWEFHFASFRNSSNRSKENRSF